jgi:Ca-activated chloride channel family protein
VIRRPAWFVLFALLAALPASSQEDNVIRVNVRLVRLLVTVKDAFGQLLGSLNKPDFTVYDNGVKQEIAVFERQTEQPLSVSLLVDNSASVGIELRYELDSVSKFMKAMLSEGNSLDAVALYDFNWRVELLRSFTRRYVELDRLLRTMKPTGGTSLYDAIYLASRDLEDRRGRHVMVVVTDGGDTTSTKDFHGALQALQLADTVIYPILVMPITNDAGRNVGGENALTTFAKGTGGRVFMPAGAAELDHAFSEILRELRTQYSIGFYPRDVPPTKDRFHILKLDVQGKNLRVVTRNGYYGDAIDTAKGTSR